jgi:hypothetical protein
MPFASSSDVKFEIGHVLFIDIVGYSKLLINEQSELLRTSKEIERSEAVKTPRRLLSISAGDRVSLEQLKIDPVWDPIRNDPGFHQLLAGKEQIGPNK